MARRRKPHDPAEDTRLRLEQVAARSERDRLRLIGVSAQVETVKDPETGMKHWVATGQRKDVFQVLLERKAIEQAAFDAIRRYETDLGIAMGQNTPERRPDHIRATTEGAPGQGISQAMIEASRRVGWIEGRLTDRQIKMLEELRLNVAAQWRAIVQMHTGETHDVAHGTAVRAMADAIRHGYMMWDRQGKKAA